ncbi:MAG: hypothetical protein CM15mP6_3450 [Methanobacteriota archaeon]|nr:MAG: hypothetical protein CM15mP6_3450 [Euryarchaeota archaeon]
MGNPLALLRHVEDYTTRELDLRNEIRGRIGVRVHTRRLIWGFPDAQAQIP